MKHLFTEMYCRKDFNTLPAENEICRSSKGYLQLPPQLIMSQKHSHFLDFY